MFHGQTPLVELKYDSYLKLFCQIAQMVNINRPHLLRDMFLSKSLYNMNAVRDYKKKHVFEVGFVL